MRERRGLGEFQLLVLAAIKILGSEAYGPAIHDQIAKLDGGLRSEVASATYITLERLQTSGLVAARMGEPTPVRGGRAKRFFKLTKEGCAALRSWVKLAEDVLVGLEIAKQRGRK